MSETTTATVETAASAKDIRAWALANPELAGGPVGTRGLLPTRVKAAYATAHAATVKSKRAPKKTAAKAAATVAPVVAITEAPTSKGRGRSKTARKGA